MTQIVAAGNHSYAVVAADRRFTVNGALVDEADDERNKLMLIATRTARLGVAFCGLGRLGPFETERWLAVLLLETLRAGGGTPDLELLCRRATDDFAALRADVSAQKCVWIVMAGFVSEPDGVTPAYAFVSNAELGRSGLRAGAFRSEVFEPEGRDQQAYAMSLGAVHVRDASVDELKTIVTNDNPPEATVGAALRILREARRDSSTGDLVGDRCGSVVVWSEKARQPEGRYFGQRGATRQFMPTLVTSERVHLNVTLDRPRMVAPRNGPCPCGSGKRFRACHGARSSGVRGRPRSSDG